MAVGKEICGKIQSVSNTKKINKAREMISVSKILKPKDSMRAARSYSQMVRYIVTHLG